jgi:hypothetical protein
LVATVAQEGLIRYHAFNASDAVSG